MRWKMAVSYKKLWKMLIDKDMKKKDLAAKAGVSPATIAKMKKDGATVSSDVLVKILNFGNSIRSANKRC